MTQRKAATKLQKASTGGTSRKASTKVGVGNGARSAVASKSSRNGSSKLPADELMLRLWKKIYEDHHPVKKGQHQ